MSNSARPLPEGTVTVLFTDVEGSTALTSRLGDETARSLLRSVENVIREQIEAHHGVNVKGLGDGIMGAFQSARRAVDCSIAIQRELDRRPVRPDTPLRVRIGLNTGEVIHEREDLFGSAVNAAQRIESAAEPGTILISSTTRALLGQTPDVSLIDRGPTELKGFDEPWTLYEVGWRTRAGIAPGESTPFVGRDGEYSRLLGLVERAAGGGSLIFIAGEPGIGKSRLTEEVCREARTRGALVLVGHCQEEGRQPYLPFVEMLERAAEVVPHDAFRRALGANAPEVAKLMPELRARFDDIPDPVPLPAEQERRFMLGSIRDFLGRAAAAQPMLLVFEDVQWADESTLLLLRRLAQRIAEMRLVVIATYRDVDLGPRHPLTEMTQDLVRQRQAEEILLDTFDRSEVEALLGRVAGSAPPAHVTSLVYDETEGNPFFVEELYRHLVESGKLFDADGAWTGSLQLAEDEVPRGVRLLIERRMQRLTDDCRSALVYAALSGRTFSYDVLGALVDIDDDRLLDAVEEAERAGVIREVSTGRDTRYSFVHEQFRQTLIGSVSSPRRQRMHRQVGEVLEETYGDDAPRHADEIAHHFYEAGSAADADKAGAYLTLAAERALSALAYEDARWYLDAADTADPKAAADTRARRAHLHALTLRGLGRIDEAFAQFEKALELAKGNGEYDRILRSRAELYSGLFRGHEAVRDFQALLENARASGDKHSELQTLLGLGHAFYVVSLNDPEHASDSRDTLERAYELGRELGDKAAMARARMRTMYFTDFWPEYGPTAAANLREAVALAEDTGDEGLLLDTLIAAWGYRLGNDRPEHVRADYERLRERLESRRDPLRLKEHYFHGMWFYRGIAEFTEAVAVCDAATVLAGELGVPPVMYPTLKSLALADMGRYGDALAALEGEIIDEPFGYAFRELGRSGLLHWINAHDEAVELSRHVAEMMAGLGRVAMRAGALGTMARSLIALGRVDEAAAVMSELPSDARTEVRLAQGDISGALERLENGITKSVASGQRRAAIVAGEAKVRALVALDRSDDAIAQADRWLAEAIETQFRSIEWRLHLARGHARRSAGHRGASEDFAAAASVVRTLADTIADDAGRERFLSDPLVTSIEGLGVET